MAFVGRSNVGKSTLINAILGARRAPVSRTPGKTRTIRLYLWKAPRSPAVCLVDLPGYGWADLPAHVRAAWGPLIEGYLRTRETLRGVVVVVDLRRGGTDLDNEMATWLRVQGIPYIVVATKVDKVNRGARPALLLATARATLVAVDEIVTFAAPDRDGLHVVRRAVRRLAEERAGATGQG